MTHFFRDTIHLRDSINDKVYKPLSKIYIELWLQFYPCCTVHTYHCCGMWSHWVQHNWELKVSCQSWIARYILYTVRQFNGWRYCLALCDEIFVQNSNPLCFFYVLIQGKYQNICMNLGKKKWSQCGALLAFFYIKIEKIWVSPSK